MFLVNVQEDVDAHSVGIQHGSPQIGGRHRVTLADLATAVDKRRTAQPTPHLTPHTIGPVPYHSIQSSAVQNTVSTRYLALLCVDCMLMCVFYVCTYVRK